MIRRSFFKWIFPVFVGILLLVSCPSPSSPEADAVPSAPSKPHAQISIDNGAVSQGDLYQTTATTVISFNGSNSTPVQGSTITSYDWDFDDGNTSDIDITSHTFSANEFTYQVTLTVTDTNGQTDTDTVEILINDPPTVSITSGNVTENEGVNCNFTPDCDDTPGEYITYYRWDMDDGTIIEGSLSEGDSVPAAVHCYTHGGSFTVTLTVTDDDGTQASDTVTADISDPDNNAPIASFTVDDEDVNRNVNITFDASGSSDTENEIVSYEWEFGDSTTGEGEIVTHSYSRGGNYRVTLTVTDLDGASHVSTTDNIIVNYQPMASFDVDAPGDGIGYLINEDLQFTSHSTDTEPGILSYNWNFGDGDTSTNENPTHSYTSAGAYTVSLTVTDSEGDSDITSLTEIINAPPTVTITGIPTGNWVNQSSEFTLSSNVVDTNDNTFTYLWVMGDSTTYTTATVTHTYMDSDDRVITLTVKDPTGHSGTDSISLDVNAAPTVTFTMDVGDGRINPDEAIIFTSTATEPDGDALTYDWRVNGTNFSTLANPTNTFTTPGTYTILLTVTDTRGAQGSDTAVVTVNAPPMASFSTNSNYTVEAGSISFTNTSTDTEDSSLDYNWNFGDGGSSSSASPSHTYNAYGSYTVTLTVTDDDDLTDNATTVIEVNALPVAAITETPSENKVDMGASFTLKGNTSSDPDDSIVSYLWTMSDNTTYTTANITHTFSTNADGDITLQVTDEDGETGTATYTISVNGAPVADFSQDKVLINPGGTVSFTANATDPDSDTLNYSWNFGDGNTGTGVSPTHAYANTGDYTVVLTVSDGRLNTVVTKINLIHVNAAPIANAGVDQTLDYSTNGSTVYLNGSASSDAEGQTLTYLWTFETLPSESLLDNGDIAGPASASPSFDISGESAAARASITGTLVYILDLQVTDSLGETDQDQVTITISGTGAINVIIE